MHVKVHDRTRSFPRGVSYPVEERLEVRSALW